MSDKTGEFGSRDDLRVEPGRLRWRCEPDRFPFDSTADMTDCPINIIGQPRAQEALELGLSSHGQGYNIFVSGNVGSGRSTVVRRMLADMEKAATAPDDLAFVHNFQTPDQPCRLAFAAGKGKEFRQAMQELIEVLGKAIPQMFDSEPYRQHRAAAIEAATAEQKSRVKEFEKQVQEEGFAMAQVQVGPFVRPHLVPVVAGNPVEVDQLETLVEEDKFKREDLEELRKKQSALKVDLEALSKQARKMDRELRKRLLLLDRALAQPVVEEAVAEVFDSFEAEGLEAWLDQVAEDLLDGLAAFRDGEEAGGEGEEAHRAQLERQMLNYVVNLLVDNSKTDGRPVIWETNPSYRNLFGSIEKTRSESGEWETDHTRIKAGSLLQANGGFLVLDALDVLVEPGVWAALKRTLRHSKVEIQSVDPVFMFGGVSLKPEPVPIDVKIVMIGTRHIYNLLHAHDEDFKKIFKVKAEFATQTPNSDDELMNYACLVHKKCDDEELPPFRREAVAAVVEEGVRMAGSHDKLTTRFSEIVDLIREAAYWARKGSAETVLAEHVDRAVSRRIYRVDLIEEMLRERIADGTVLLDLEGRKVGQVNGLAVMDVGDHIFAQPARITATTALGRAGIIDIDREAAMSGSIHTKGVLILTGFLRERFAQQKPLALTASIVFEQNYGGVDGDSASSAELYALLSSLAEVELRQCVAVTGSVNQRGEIQPIGGLNEKIEGYFDLCRLKGLTGEQGAMIPKRNLGQLMLRKDVVEAVAGGTFHVWAVSTIEEGLEVLTGMQAGRRGEDETYPADTVFGKADAKLSRLAEQVNRFGVADVGGA